MEGMPVSQYPELATQKPGFQARSIVQPPAPQQSLDSIPPKDKARPASALLKKRRQKKTVHWDHSVIDNERKPKVPSVRPLTPPLQKRSTSSAAPPQSSIYPNPSPNPPTSIRALASVANISVRMDSSYVRLPMHSVIPSGQSTFLGQEPRYPIQRPNQAVVESPSRMPPTHISSTQRPDQAPAANSSSKKSRGPRSPRSAVQGRSSLPSNATEVKTERPKTKLSRVPPRVPDPPRPEMQGPPPTPRITRLPTPELPDISGRKFCMCANCKRLVESKGKPVHVKMNAQSKKPCGPSTEEHC
jgi:hypothetical protein